jgi:DNA-binding transcriptional LysR family regulator
LNPPVSLRVLRYVVASAEAGNVTEAARRLNVSQPSVSAAIAQLEATIGFPIFVRHHARGITLTSAGARLVHDARQLLNHADDFERNARSLGDALQGEITAGCFTTLTARFMPQLLADFAALHPGIAVRVAEGDQEEIVQGLVAGRTEVALSYNYALPDEVLGEHLADLPPQIIVAADHPLAAASAVSLHAFADEPFILLDLPHSRDYFTGLFAACGIEPHIACRSRSLEFIRGMVGRGLGYSIHNVMPRSGMTYDGSQVVVLPITEALPPVRIMRLRLRRSSMRPAVEAFWAYLERAFAPGAGPA